MNHKKHYSKLIEDNVIIHHLVTIICLKANDYS